MCIFVIIIAVGDIVVASNVRNFHPKREICRNNFAGIEVGYHKPQMQYKQTRREEKNHSNNNNSEKRIWKIDAD